MKNILYIRPPQSSKSGIRFYSDAVYSAFKKYSSDNLHIVDFARKLDELGNIYYSFNRHSIKRYISDLQNEGYFKNIDLMITEIGISEFAEFFTLIEIKKLYPNIPSLVVVHDPPKTVINLSPKFFKYQGFLVVRVIRKIFNIIFGSNIEKKLYLQNHSYLVLSKIGVSLLDKKIKKFNVKSNNISYIPHINLYNEEYTQITKENKVINKVVVGYFGFISKAKGLDLLLKAVNELNEGIMKGLPKIKIQIAGGTQQRKDVVYLKKLKKYVHDNNLNDIVEFINYLEQEKVPSFISNLDILVLPYRKTGSGSASGPLMWAKSFGIPVIASNTRNFPEMIYNDVNGLLFEADDYISLKNHIIELLCSPNYLDMLKKGAEQSRDENSWEKTIFRLKSIIEKL